MGVGTTHPYELYLADPQGGTANAFQEADLVLPDGGRIVFKRTNCGPNCAGRCSTSCPCPPSNCSFAGAVFEHHAPTTECPNCVGSPTPFDGAKMVDVSTNGTGPWELRLKNGTVYRIPFEAKLDIIRDRFGNQLRITRTSPTGSITRITSPTGRWVDFTYGATNCSSCIRQITDNVGRTVQYAYDTSSRLTTVTDANGGVTTYEYDDTQPDADQRTRIIKVRDANQNFSCGRTSAAAPPCSPTPTLEQAYDGTGKVSTQKLADGTSTYTFTYQANSVCDGGTNDGTACTTNGQCTGGGVCAGSTTTLTDPRNVQREVRFNRDGYSLRDAQGSSARVVRYGRQAKTNRVTSRIERLTSSPCRERRTTFQYDPWGNPLTITRASGFCGGPYNTILNETRFTYEPTFNQLTSITTAVGAPEQSPTVFSYDQSDPLVRLTSIRDGANYLFPVTINRAGQITSVSDPQNHATTFKYDGADLVEVTDPTQKTTRRSVDAAGRVRGVIDPLGQRTLYDYDNLNRLTKVTDPIGASYTPARSIDFHYDPNGNLDRVTDNRHSPTAPTTQYHYNVLNQLDWRKDPLLRQESFAYDALGNLLTHTDRRGLITDFRYDALGRRSCAGFQRTGGTGDCTIAGNYQGGTIGYQYDAGSRLTQASDSLAGTVSRTYDHQDNLASEYNPQVAFDAYIEYTHDSINRRTTMTTGFSSPVTVYYCYDGGDRLTAIRSDDCSSTTTPLVKIDTDSAGRPSIVTLSNGVSVSYGYDDASRISSLNYKKGTGVLSGLTYTYDGAGNRTIVGSNGARTGLPTALGSPTSPAIYDLADELKTWNAPTPVYQYDGNGNLTSDGVNTYVWNARNQLASISGGVTATFQYDAFGRRTQKTLGATTRRFHYDGVNPVRELDGTGAVVANLLTGLGVDEVFTRTDGAGRRTLLPDALGSTLSLSDDSGNLQNHT